MLGNYNFATYHMTLALVLDCPANWLVLPSGKAHIVYISAWNAKLPKGTRRARSVCFGELLLCFLSPFVLPSIVSLFHFTAYGSILSLAVQYVFHCCICSVACPSSACYTALMPAEVLSRPQNSPSELRPPPLCLYDHKKNTEGPLQATLRSLAGKACIRDGSEQVLLVYAPV